MGDKDLAMEIRELQKDLKAIRGAYISYVERKYRRANKRKLDNLESYDCEVTDDIIEPPTLSVDMRNCSEMEVAKIKNNVKKYIILLQILRYKKDCTVSNIIDKI